MPVAMQCAQLCRRPPRSLNRHTMQFDTTEEHDNTTDVIAAVRRWIREADPPEVGPRDYEPLTLVLRDADGRIRGGAYGSTMWGWLMLDGLWIGAATLIERPASAWSRPSATRAQTPA